MKEEKRNFRPKGDGRSGPWGGGSATREKLNILEYLTLKRLPVLSQRDFYLGNCVFCFQ